MTRVVARFVVVVGVVLALSVGSAHASSSSDVPATRFRSLAARAVHDPGALRRLRSVSSVDGHPVDISRLLSGASGRELDTRLRTLSHSQGEATDAAGARDGATRVLSDPKFQASTPPRPLGGLFDRIGRALADPVRWVEGILHDLSLSAPGGSAFVWLVGIALILLALFLLSARMIGRRSKSLDRDERLYGVFLADPDELERRATEAERESRFEDALRLLYVAGILRLDQAGIISLTDSLTPRQIQRQVGQGPLVDLTQVFERVVYGRREATAQDVEDARATWAVLTRGRRAA